MERILGAGPNADKAVSQDLGDKSYTAVVNLRRMHLGVAGLLLGACLLSASTFRGQSGPGLEGKVLDPSGGIIIGADVILFSDDRVLTTKTNESGIFQFSNVPASARYIEVSSNGFFARSLPIRNEVHERLSFTLWVGEGSRVTSECSPPDDMRPPSVAYDDRSGAVNLTGTVTDLSRVPLPYSSLTLLQSDLSAALDAGYLPRHGLGMKERSFKQTPIAELVSNEKGEFQFTQLEPGWYTLKVAHDGYSTAIVKFWVARENLTRLSRIYLYPVPSKCR